MLSPTTLVLQFIVPLMLIVWLAIGRTSSRAACGFESAAIRGGPLVMRFDGRYVVRNARIRGVRPT